MLKDIVTNIIVVAHKENVDELVGALAGFALPIDVQRKAYSEIELGYPAITRCLLNHADAWEKASRTDGYTLICEADFVPIREIERQPTDWLPDEDVAWAHLYTSSPRLIEPVRNGIFRVQLATTVCYMINPIVAGHLLGFVQHYRDEYGLDSLFAWDTFLQWYVMGKGGRLYMPPRSLGQHGGIANTEHTQNGMKHNGMHRADSLAGSLAFTPQYVRADPRGAWKQTLYFRLAGFGKVLLGMWIIRNPETRWTPADLVHSTLRGITRLI